MTAIFEQLFVGPLGWGFAAVWGALWGSFFNVLVVRVPAGESVVRPASHCRNCRRPLRWYDNVPIFSYLLLRGRCRQCGARFSPRYALVEALVALLALAVHHVYVVAPGGPFAVRLAQFFILSLFCGLLCAIALIDLETMRIPNAITYPGIPVAVFLSLFLGHPGMWDGFVGAVGGYLAIRLTADGYEWLTGRQGMGYGDAKLLALVGGLLGWRALLPVLFFAAFQGSVIGIGMLVWLRRRAKQRGGRGFVQGKPVVEPEPQLIGRDGENHASDGSENDENGEKDEKDISPLRHARIPFGPFLSLAAIELILAPRLIAQVFPFML